VIFRNFLKNVVVSLNHYQKQKKKNKERGRILYFDKEGFLREQVDQKGDANKKKPA
jgi:hypothetical protein